MRPAAPSQDSNVKDKLYNFLSDVNCRFFFNKVVKFEKEIENLSSKNLFLQKCIDENVIPNTFIVANKPQGDPRDEWSDAALKHLKVS